MRWTPPRQQHCAMMALSISHIQGGLRGRSLHNWISPFRLDELGFAGKQALIRTVVRRTKIDRNHVEVAFRVPPPTPATSSLSESPPDSDFRRHYTGDRGAHDCMLVRDGCLAKGGLAGHH